MRRLINELTAVSLGQERGDPLSENVKRTLREVSALFKDARPRKVSAFTNEVCYIFTDASFEPESCEGGIGAVLVSPQGTIASWFSHMLSKEECRPFMRQGQRQCICELEAVTILAAIRMWKHVVAARHTIFFVDNEGSRFAILRGWSQNEILAQISFRVAQEEDLACIYGWYARVPTASNIADFPSRGVGHELLPECSRQAFDPAALKLEAS